VGQRTNTLRLLRKARTGGTCSSEIVQGMLESRDIYFIDPLTWDWNRYYGLIYALKLPPTSYSFPAPTPPVGQLNVLYSLPPLPPLLHPPSSHLPTPSPSALHTLPIHHPHSPPRTTYDDSAATGAPPLGGLAAPLGAPPPLPLCPCPPPRPLWPSPPGPPPRACPCPWP
jgi:hypothetical protein